MNMYKQLNIDVCKEKVKELLDLASRCESSGKDKEAKVYMDCAIIWDQKLQDLLSK